MIRVLPYGNDVFDTDYGIAGTGGLDDDAAVASFFVKSRYTSS